MTVWTRSLPASLTPSRFRSGQVARSWPAEPEAATAELEAPMSTRPWQMACLPTPEPPSCESMAMVGWAAFQAGMIFLVISKTVEEPPMWMVSDGASLDTLLWVFFWKPLRKTPKPMAAPAATSTRRRVATTGDTASTALLNLRWLFMGVFLPCGMGCALALRLRAGQAGRPDRKGFAPSGTGADRCPTECATVRLELRCL